MRRAAVVPGGGTVGDGPRHTEAAALHGRHAVVGRSAELRVLDAALRTARDGHGAAVLLVGSAGIGKTCLMTSARGHARRLGLATAASWCWREGTPPLWPWLDLLDQLDRAPADSRELAAEGFDGFRRIERAVRAATAHRPALLAVDDLHYGDEATVLLTRYLAPRMVDLPAVLLLAGRPLDDDADSDRDGRLLVDVERSCTVLRLAPLSAAAVAELAALHGHVDLPPEATDALTVASGGNPLHAVAALTALPAGATRLDPSTRFDVAVVRRLRQLPAHDRAVVARAAVLGPATVGALAAVCATSTAQVAGAVAAAEAAGLFHRSGGQVAFRHELVRDAVVASLDPAQVVATHAAAAAFYARAPHAVPGAPARAARHALRAAGRSPADATVAVELARRAAADLVESGAPDVAVELLDAAVEANELADRPLPRSRLLIERAAGVLVAGRLSAAHHQYVLATEAAQADGDEVAVAEAAAGLGGLWVNAVRSPIEQRRVLYTQRRALAALPPGHHALRLRLRTRIAAEAMFWEGASADALLEAVAAVRASDDVETVVEMLSVAHNSLLAPEHTALRLELAEELPALAARHAPGGIWELMALCWRAVSLFLAGDERAERALADLREPAEVVQNLSVLYVVRVIEVMLLIRQGRLTDAEHAARAAYELGVRAEDADALSYLAGQLVTIRWFQGREGELLDVFEQLISSANLDGVDRSFEAGIAVVAARAGRRDLARRQLHRLTRAGISALPRFSTWLTSLTAILEAAALLDDRDTVATAYALLEPFGPWPVAPSLAVTCLGCAHRWLGIGARALGRPADSERHLRDAIEANLRLGHDPATAVVRAELADLLLAHDVSPVRSSEARTLYDAAIGDAEQLGMTVLAGRWRKAADRGVPDVRVRIVRERDVPSPGWTVDFDGRRTRVRHLVGMRYLALLTSSPGRWVEAAGLVADAVDPPAQARHLVLDAPARRSLEQRIRTLAARVGEARERGDPAAQAAAEEELDAVAGHLSAASGVAGRPRQFLDEAERARTAVRKAVVRAVDEIAAVDPAAAVHLRERVVTGARCRYVG